MFSGVIFCFFCLTTLDCIFIFFIKKGRINKLKKKKSKKKIYGCKKKKKIFF